MKIRVGHGYDVHRLVQERALILGGVEIPHTHGLLGHSDADVLTHAVMDALLGAAGLRDIGTHFPDSDPSYQNSSSILLLAQVGAMLEKDGWQLGNIDATIVAQTPKLAPFLAQMCQTLAQTLCCRREQINVKATTEEGLGFTGDGAGIAAHAVVLIQKED